MKNKTKIAGIVVGLMALFCSTESMAISLVYRGLECNGYGIPGSASRESRFEVLSDEGGGVYRLRLTNGIPQFNDNSTSACVDSGASSIGSETASGSYEPTRLLSAEATGMFSGTQLIIVINAIYPLSAAGSVYPTTGQFFSGPIYPVTNVLMFDFNGSSFRLSRHIQNFGSINVSGMTSPAPGGIIRSVTPAVSAATNTPLATIEYFLEN